MATLGEPFRKVDYRDLPALEYYSARDGARLAYRSYPAAASDAGQRQVAVLIHGASDSSEGMHAVAKTLAREHVAVYVPDVRGHGANEPHGDIRYNGQLDDDLSDLVQQLRPRHPGSQWILIGFSAGGGFALRIDGGVNGGLFDRYLLLAPGLRYDAPTARPLVAPSQGKNGDTDLRRFVSPYVGRLVALTILGNMGIRWFDGLPVLAFAVPSNSKRLTATYSMRLVKSFAPHEDYMADIRNIHKPTTILVGSNDEFSLPERFAPVFHSQRPDVAVKILPGLNHLDMVTDPVALQAVAEAVR